MQRQAVIATVLVLAHQVIAVFHGQAHDELGVGLTTWQWTYVYTVITAAPLLAMILYWTKLRATGALLLGVSMVGSFAFGVYYHFIAISPDNVNHLPEGHAQGMFVATAVLLAISEAATAAFGFWSFGKLRPMPATASL